MTTSVDTTDPRRSQSEDSRDAEDFPEAVVDAAVDFLGKPRLRGWIHVYAAVIAAIAGAALVSVSWALQGTRAGLATMLYTFTIVAMFTVSGTYHRVNWKSERARKWMK
ncbi:MAG TPA: hemolysin III family protein, partial [Mycobacterium sp.]|nr:hemolysin III family protein [Mycobacterium sp.]